MMSANWQLHDIVVPSPLLSLSPSPSPSSSRRRGFSIYEDPTADEPLEGSDSSPPALDYSSRDECDAEEDNVDTDRDDDDDDDQDSVDDSIYDGYHNGDSPDVSLGEIEGNESYIVEDDSSYINRRDSAAYNIASEDIPIQSIEMSPQLARKSSSYSSPVKPRVPSVMKSPTPDSPFQARRSQTPILKQSRSRSRRMSAISAVESTISSIPPSISAEIVPYDHDADDNDDKFPRSPYTPHKQSRSTPNGGHAFRTPSSVRAMQMSSPPVSPLASPRSSGFGLHKRHSELRHSSRRGTPTRQQHHHHNHSRDGSAMSSPRATHRTESDHRHLSRKPEPDANTHHPLVLLHITLLPPAPLPYPPHILGAVLPPHILRNMDLLHAKATDTVISRGILVPHPRDDYELLEERLLESLELVEARVLKCGHFFLGDAGGSETPPLRDEDNDDDDISITTGSDSTLKDDEMANPPSRPRRRADTAPATSAAADHHAHDTDTDALCAHCQHPLKLASLGTGRGPHRFDVRFYAANGLMRSGAWAAAWAEMERVDVEVGVWVPEELRRRMEQLMEAEERRRRQLREEEEEEERQRGKEREEAARQVEVEVRAAARRRQQRQQQQQQEEEEEEEEEGRRGEMGKSAKKRELQREVVPLATLLRNYVYLLLVAPATGSAARNPTAKRALSTRTIMAMAALGALVALGLAARLFSAPSSGVDAAALAVGGVGLSPPPPPPLVVVGEVVESVGAVGAGAGVAVDTGSAAAAAGGGAKVVRVDGSDGDAAAVVVREVGEGEIAGDLGW